MNPFYLLFSTMLTLAGNIICAIIHVMIHPIGEIFFFLVIVCIARAIIIDIKNTTWKK